MMLKGKRIFKIAASFVIVLSLLMTFICGMASLTKAESANSGRASNGGVEDQKIIWKYFMSKYNNAYGVAGLMGNLYAESGLKSNNLQNSYERKLGYNDDSYTKGVDNGTYSNFVTDSAGYGLAQWTYYTRKRSLLNFAEDRDASIGDFAMQLDFLYQELNQSFWSVVQTLKNATSVLEASNAVLLKFERPADQSTAVQNTRASYGQMFYNKYHDLPLDTTEAQTQTTKPAQTTKPSETSDITRTTDPTEPAVTPGDINDDKRIDTTDYILIKTHLLSIRLLEGRALKAADANDDGRIDATDYITVKRIMLFKNALT